MAKIVSKKTSEESASDVSKSLNFMKGGSGLEEVEEEEIETTQVDEEEDELDEEESVEDSEDIEEDEEEKAEVDYKKLFEKSEEEKQKLLDKVLKGDEKVKPKEPEVIQEVEFLSTKDISDEDFENAISSKESFIKTYNDFGNKVRATVLNEVMNSLPGTISNMVNFQVELANLNKDFYRDNPDLVKVKKYVGKVADELIKENGINSLSDYGKMLKELPNIVRKELDLAAPIKKKGSEKSPKEPLARSQRRGGKESIEEKLSPLQKDIQRSLSFIRSR